MRHSPFVLDNRFATRLSSALIGPLLLGLVLAGCGDDDMGAGGEIDSGTENNGDGATGTGDSGAMSGCVPEGTRCPNDAPDEGANMCGSCCYRHSNADSEAAGLRVASLALEEPASLASTVVSGLLQGTLDEETFNWLIQINGATDEGGAVTVKTGFGVRNEDHTFSFSLGGAPAPGDPGRWDPVEVAATIEGDVISAEPYDGTMTVPVFDQDAETLSLELSIRAIEVESATLSEDLSCIGARGVTKYRNDAGRISGYLTVDDAKAGDVEVTPDQTINLCMLIANMSTAEGSCDTIPRGSWPLKPNALCDDTGCTTDTCDPNTDCNAWKLVGGFAAHGVQITN